MAENGNPDPGRGVGQALRDAAIAAMRAPSILNTQPWRWHIHGEILDLHADRSRQVASIDPQARLLTLSCGAALHHARVILAAHGREPVVALLPDAEHAGLLARVTIAGAYAATARDIALARAIRRRRSDRRPFVAPRPIQPGRLQALGEVATVEGVCLHRVTDDQRYRLDEAARRAQLVEARNEGYRRELQAWTDDRPPGAGVPSHTLVAASDVPVPLRDFAAGGETGLDPGFGDDRFADYLILATECDATVDWLHAGQATSAVWLAGTVDGLAASALSDLIEVGGARGIVASLLPRHGFPQLVLRIGVDAQPAPPPASPRLRPEEVIDVDPPEVGGLQR